MLFLKLTRLHIKGDKLFGVNFDQMFKVTFFQKPEQTPGNGQNHFCSLDLYVSDILGYKKVKGQGKGERSP